MEAHMTENMSKSMTESMAEGVTESITERVAKSAKGNGATGRCEDFYENESEDVCGNVYKTACEDESETACECSTGRKKERSVEEYTKLIHRLNRIEGQVRGIRRMVENDAYCTDILTQSSAVAAALNAFNKELLANHIRTCVADDIRDGKDEVIDDLVNTLQKLMK